MKTMTRGNSLLQQEQVERLMQIGAYLRHVREENVLSLEEIAARTLVQTRMLKAIEEGKLHQLPEPVYVQGFIRRYADALGLEGNEFAEAFPAERSLQLSQKSWKDSPAAQLRPLHLYIAYVALIMASVSLLSWIVGRSAVSDRAVQDRSNLTNQAIAPANSGNTNSGNTNSGNTNSGTSSHLQTVNPSERITPSAALRSPKVQDRPVQIDVKLTAQSWLEVEVDGSVKIAEVLAEGTERTWSGDQQIRVRAGNAGGVMVVHNGGKPEPMGVPGAVEEKSFTPAPGQKPANPQSNGQKQANATHSTTP